MVNAWIGPAILAALIAALVNVAGWFVAFRNDHRLRRMQRAEKVRDFQIALRAEVASELQLLDAAGPLEEHLATITERYEREPGYSVHVPHMAPSLVFDAILKEIHVLPGSVIGPAVDYERRRRTVEQFATSLRGEAFSSLSAERQLEMYADYLGARLKLRRLARAAAEALDRGLADD